MAFVTVNSTTYPKTFQIILNAFETAYGYKTTTVFFENILSVSTTTNQESVVIARLEQESLYITCLANATFQNDGTPVYAIVDNVNGQTFTSNQQMCNYILNLIR